jgi:hypothetical protein
LKARWYIQKGDVAITKTVWYRKEGAGTEKRTAKTNTPPLNIPGD